LARASGVSARLSTWPICDSTVLVRRNLLVLGCTLLFACTRTGTRTQAEPAARPEAQAAPSAQPPMDVAALVAALNTFGLDLYARWGHDNTDSYVLAPASIGLALLQLLHGASGETAAQIARSLQLGTADRAGVVEAARELQRKVFDAGATAAGMRFASRLFADDSLVIDPTFAATSHRVPQRYRAAALCGGSHEPWPASAS
jgi:serine protease inhibitor